jgi:CheY-like chemotaxis protein
MAALLRRWGCVVLPATSDTEALSWINGGHVPHAILADFHLDHDLEGCSAIYRLREAAGQNIPAAIISADRSDDTRAKLRTQQLPMLNKPVKPNRLRALLASLIVNH